MEQESVSSNGILDCFPNCIFFYQKTFGGFRFYLLFCTLDMNWQHRHEHNDIAITDSDGTGDVVQAVTNYQDAKLLAELSEDLGEAMVGIDEQEIELLMAERGK